MQKKRIIGIYKGQQPGPMLIAIGGIHGNEPAGNEAIETFLQNLENEAKYNLNFKFRGTFLGLRGNCQAIENSQRFIEKDLNRQWVEENIKRVFSEKIENLHAEDYELRDLLQTIKSEIKEKLPYEILFLDFHTTTAEGGAFAIVTDEENSIKIANELNVPVVKGLLRGIEGTSLHYFTTKNFEIPTAAIAFEAGQHLDKLSVNRCIAVLTNALIALQCVQKDEIENPFNAILNEETKNLPQLSELLYCHRIRPEDEFCMKPGYKNFQDIKKGEIIANDINGVIQAPYDCQILMPLYQKQGSDGFFLIKSI
jgi:succinylglutamate desuccinylase